MQQSGRSLFPERGLLVRFAGFTGLHAGSHSTESIRRRPDHHEDPSSGIRQRGPRSTPVWATQELATTLRTPTQWSRRGPHRPHQRQRSPRFSTSKDAARRCGSPTSTPATSSPPPLGRPRYPKVRVQVLRHSYEAMLSEHGVPILGQSWNVASTSASWSPSKPTDPFS